VLAAKDTCVIRRCSSAPVTRQLPAKSTLGKAGNSSRGSPFSLKRVRPLEMKMESPCVVISVAPGSSRAISWSFLAGAVMAPGSATSAGTRTLTAVSRSVPLIRTAPSSASIRMFESTGRVVRVGMLPATAPRPCWRFSRVMVNRIRCPQPRLE
jgi:hypothetical protein